MALEHHPGWNLYSHHLTMRLAGYIRDRYYAGWCAAESAPDIIQLQNDRKSSDLVEAEPIKKCPWSQNPPHGSPETMNRQKHENMQHQTQRLEPWNRKNNDFDTSFTVINENLRNTKVASMKPSKNTLQFWRGFYKCFHDFYDNHTAQRWPMRATYCQNNDFDTILLW